MIRIFQEWDGRYEVPLKYFKFSGGEMQVSVGAFSTSGGPPTQILIEAHLITADDVMALLMINEALRRRLREDGYDGTPVALVMPYIPYARQDRVMEKGEALGIKAFSELINNMKFNQVTVWDSHSDVALGLLNNVYNYGPEAFVRQIPIVRADTVLVAPDAGAIKKVSKVASLHGFDMVSATKHRSTKDGTITGTEVHSGHIGVNNFLIVDDICDGGRTFTELAKVLRPLTAGKVLLYVTHGIFSKGLDPFRDLIDHIYCAKPWPGLESNELLTILPSGGGKAEGMMGLR